MVSEIESWARRDRESNVTRAGHQEAGEEKEIRGASLVRGPRSFQRTWRGMVSTGGPH